MIGSQSQSLTHFNAFQCKARIKPDTENTQGIEDFANKLC